MFDIMTVYLDRINVMNTQIGQGTKLPKLLLDEIWEQYLLGKGESSTTTKQIRPYENIKAKILGKDSFDLLSVDELKLLKEVFEDLNKLVRTQGKRAVGFGKRLTELRTRVRETQ
jgi:hypothetical protein